MSSEDIYNNPCIYSFLIDYYLLEQDDPYFNREIEQAADTRLFLSEQFAAWLPWDKNYNQILNWFAQIHEKAG